MCTSTFVGTMGFIAPEVYTAQGRIYNEKVDIWAAGSVFYTMLFGYCPFLVGRNFQFNHLQNMYGLYLPTDLSGKDYCDRKLT